jgi:pimeloyl-ACP methyl ester carboxylesterase
MIDVIEIKNRRIGIHQYGNKDGIPVFYCHAFPGSRLDGNVLNFNEHAIKADVRIIAVDRPGIGLSDYQSKRSLLDWGDDISVIADKLNINKFSIVGFSGGGPYALSCASKMPERIHSVGFVSGMGPIEYKESKKDNAMLIPRQISLLRKVIATAIDKSIRHTPGIITQAMRTILPKADVDYLCEDGNIHKLQLFFSENFKQGGDGFLKESEIYRQPWGFELSRIKPRVHLWQGGVDRNVGVRSARKIAQEIPDCKVHFMDDEGHFSLIGKYLGDILEELRP